MSWQYLFSLGLGWGGSRSPSVFLLSGLVYSVRLEAPERGALTSAQPKVARCGRGEDSNLMP